VEPACWVVTDGTAGMMSQAVGLAERVGLPFTTKIVVPRAPLRWLPPGLWPRSLALGASLAPPWPRLLIATGRLAVAPALAVARAGATFTVQIQDPRVAPERFGLVVAPEHDWIRGSNVIATLGALHGVTEAKLAAARAGASFDHLPRPRVAVPVGGANRAYRFGPAEARSLGRALADLARDGGAGLMVTSSRRTGAAQVAALAAALAGVPSTIWDGRPPNPYLGFLAHADAIVVTADSVNMVSEALATGAPVHVAALPGGSAKFRRFHETLVRRGYTRPFAGALETWRYQPLDETGRVAAVVRERLGIG